MYEGWNGDTEFTENKEYGGRHKIKGENRDAETKKENRKNERKAYGCARDCIYLHREYVDGRQRTT